MIQMSSEESQSRTRKAMAALVRVMDERGRTDMLSKCFCIRMPTFYTHDARCGHCLGIEQLAIFEAERRA